MSQTTVGKTYLKELEAEVTATRKCLERIPLEVYKFKPHESSMEMGYLTLLVADIPRWMALIVEQADIDFATDERFTPATAEDVVKRFDENVQRAKKALSNVQDETLQETFSLKNSGQVLYSSPKLSQLEQTVNHMVHHRGQLTVYMRMNKIAVPSIYGPSADERNF
ncbi:DinB family protein [Niastella sp. OAS944]|uniref:DinB family protein n=1 Tax=Niastella sp. OAS944 TaxID=2664089 RepID=UPI003479C101|nr:putative damage-inducible protein DinB [Chitinophagaceae bacterium OAS944]